MEGNHEERLTKLEMARQHLEDSMLVHARLEAKASTRLEEHQERLKGHQEFLRAHEESMTLILESQRSISVSMERMVEFQEESKHKQEEFTRVHEQFKMDHEIAMKEFDGKLNALIDIVGRMRGGMEARNS